MNQQYLRFGFKSKRGRIAASLIEMSIVMMVILAVLGGAFAVASIMHDDAVARIESDRLIKFAQNVRQLRKHEGYPTSAKLTKEVIDLKLVPVGMTVQGNKIKNQWGGDIEITTLTPPFRDRPQAYNPQQDPYFSIVYKNVPKRICSLMVKYTPSGLLFYVGSGSLYDGVIRRIDDEDSNFHWNLCNGDSVYWSTGDSNSFMNAG